jgi:signal transduction histidine kinase
MVAADPVTDDATTSAGGGSGPREPWWRPRAPEVLLALALLVATFLPGLGENGVRIADLPPREIDELAVLLAVGQSAPLVLRRSAPGACLSVTALCFAAYQALGYAELFAGLGLLVALYSVGAHLETRRRAWAVASGVAYVALCLVLAALGSPEHLVDYVTFALVLAVCWAAGSWMRWNAQLETERRSAARHEATAAERARIARELHDVVTHHVTAIVVQAGAATFIVGDPARVTRSLEAIADTGRRALEDLRQQLDALGPTSAADVRAPAWEPVRALVQRASASGLTVDLVEEGDIEGLGDGVVLAVHRIVQEALTNALKHADGRPTRVRVCHHTTGVDVEVRSDGGAEPRTSTGAAVPDGSGRGLAGLAERVAVLGGTFRAGPTHDGGFAVEAHIPEIDRRVQP